MQYNFNCQYDEKDSIGKRYRRHDAIGTPLCVTIDHETLQDSAVTVRYRDTMKQERVAIDALEQLIDDQVSLTKALQRLALVE